MFMIRGRDYLGVPKLREPQKQPQIVGLNSGLLLGNLVEITRIGVDSK